MLAITNRDKVFSLFALPIAIVAIYAWVWGAGLHNDCNAYSEHIEQLGSEEDIMAQQTSLDSQLARAKKELAAYKEQRSPAVQVNGASKAEETCEVCGVDACRGKAFCSVSGARINAFRELLASNGIKIVSAAALKNGGQKIVAASALEEELDFIPTSNASTKGNTFLSALSEQYPDCKRWGFSVEANFGALSAMLKKCEQEQLPLVIEVISMANAPTSSDKKLWYIQVVL